jgi:hypothetical protein
MRQERFRFEGVEGSGGQKRGKGAEEVEKLLQQRVSERPGSAAGPDLLCFSQEGFELGADFERMKHWKRLSASVHFFAEERDGFYRGKRQRQWEEVLKEG